MPPTPAGNFPHRVTVLRRETTNDGGSPVPGDPIAAYRRLPAEVRTASEVRLERVFAAQVTAQATHVVKVRNAVTLEVKHTDVLAWHDVDRDRTLRILGSADPDGRRIELLIACSETRA